MKNYTNLLLLFALVLSISFTGCGKDDEEPDVEGPTVELRDPVEIKTYAKGGALPLDATFKDASGMKSCVVTIKYNDVATKTQLKGVGTAWTPAENNTKHIINFNGEKDLTIVLDESLPVSEWLFGQRIEVGCLGGIYTVTFDMEDKIGKTSTKTVDIVIK
ncbi:MAG: hypothetical protein JEZ14_02845 [Marinilabiliaceae bacterium]|nr:hypothetical protein [Marinilabiliaceae bacterium]